MLFMKLVKYLILHSLSLAELESVGHLGAIAPSERFEIEELSCCGGGQVPAADDHGTVGAHLAAGVVVPEKVVSQGLEKHTGK